MSYLLICIMLNHLWNPGMNSTWSWWKTILMCFWIWFSSFIEFCTHVYKHTDHCVSLYSFTILVILALENEFGRMPFLLFIYFWKEFTLVLQMLSGFQQWRLFIWVGDLITDSILLIFGLFRVFYTILTSEIL